SLCWWEPCGRSRGGRPTGARALRPQADRGLRQVDELVGEFGKRVAQALRDLGAAHRAWRRVVALPLQLPAQRLPRRRGLPWTIELIEVGLRPAADLRIRMVQKSAQRLQGAGPRFQLVDDFQASSELAIIRPDVLDPGEGLDILDIGLDELRLA